MSKANPLFKRITSLFLSLVFVLTTFAAVDFSKSAAIEAKAEENDYYMFAYFTGNEDTRQYDNNNQAIRFAVSQDGLNFKALNNNKPAIEQLGGSLNVRDPYLFKGADDYYYIVGTDLDCITMGWWGNQPQIVFWRSRDLVNWTDETYINSAQICGLNDNQVYRTWAPQVFYDEVTGKYMVYFAFAADGYNSTNMYYMLTDDLLDQSKYSLPQQLYRPYDDPANPCYQSNNKDCIDADITFQNGIYYMFYKDEGASTVCLATATNLSGPYSYVGKCATAAETANIEGCQVYKIGNNFHLVADRFSAAGRFAIYNLGSDLSAITASAGSIDMNNGNPITTVDGLNGFENLSARHGSIIHINKSQYDALISKYGISDENDVRYVLDREYSAENSWHYDDYKDASGHMFNLMTNTGGYSYVVAQGNYLSLNGATAFINDTTVKDMFVSGNSWSVSFNANVVQKRNAPLFALTSGPEAQGVNSKDWIRFLDNGDFYIHNGSTYVKIGSTEITTSVDYDFDITYDGNVITLYKEGKKEFGETIGTLGFNRYDVTNYVALGWTDTIGVTAVNAAYSNIRFRKTVVSAAKVLSEHEDNLVYQYNEGNHEAIDGRADVTYNNPRTSTTYKGKRGSSFTVAGWVNIGANKNSNAILLEFGDGGTGDNKNYLSLLEDGRINYCWNEGATDHYVDIQSIYDFALNTWYYVQINIIPDGNQWHFRTWVNGNSALDKFSDSTSSYTRMTTYSYGPANFFSRSSMPLTFGQGNVGWWADAGYNVIDDIRVYNRALDPSKLYSDIQIEELSDEARDYVRANLESYDVTSNDNAFNEVAYHEGSPAHEGSGSNITNRGYGNVVYASTTTEWNTTGYSGGSTNNNRLDFHYMYFKFPMPTNIVIVYDGTNSAYVPVEMEIQSNGSRSQRVNTAYYAGTNDQSGSNPNSFVLDDYWYGTSLDYANWCGEKNSSSYDEKVGYLSDVLSESEKQQQGNTSHFMHNRLKFIDNFNADEYYKAYNKFSFAVSGKNNSTSYSTAKAQNNSNNVYVLNYAPVYNALKSSNPTAMPNGKDNLGIKDFYTAYVKNNEDNWTESSLKQFYYAAYLLLTSNPNDYKSSFSSGVDTNVKSAADEIKNAMNAFNSINLEKRADFTALDSKFAQGESVIANLNQTNLYSESHVSALITALNDAKANAATTADERKDISENIAQSEINTQVNNLISAINAINNASACEVSALNEVIDRLNNLDDDIYDYSGKDVQAIIEALSAGIDGSDCVYTSSDSVNYTVKTVQNGVSQPLVDSAVGVGLSSLADNVRMYDVVFTGDASLNFAYEGSEEKITDNHYKSTYNNTAVFSTDNADTAWFMEYNSETTSRDKQYQGSGETYSTKVIGNMNVTVEQRCAATPNRVSIQRDYQNGKYPVQQINYVANGTDYQLPEATQILGYEFEGYYIGGERITASSVTVNSDIEISARYSASASDTFSVVVKSTQGETLYSSDDSYNTKVSVSDSGAYGWVEKISGENSYRPFCIGSDLNFYVTEATEIKAVESAAEFSAAGTLPAINIKQSDANVEIVSGRNKVFFNGQIVNDPSGEKTILEYGFIIGTTINSTPTESELVLENAGAHEDYRIIRAKSTKLVGANQFTIAVSGLSGAISYRGYVTYQIGGADGEIKTVYTSVANQVI